MSWKAGRAGAPLFAAVVLGTVLSGCAGNQPAAYKQGYDAITAGNAMVSRGITDCSAIYASYGKGWDRSEWISGCRYAEKVEASGS